MQLELDVQASTESISIDHINVPSVTVRGIYNSYRKGQERYNVGELRHDFREQT